MNEQEFAELAAGHAVNALSPDDEQVFLAALDAHPEWETIVRMDAATIVALADMTHDVAPPLALRGRLLSLIAATPQLSTADASAGDSTHAARRDAPVAAATPVNDVRPSQDDPADTSPGLMISTEPPTDTQSIQAVSRARWTRGLFALAASLVLLIALGFGAAFIGQQLNTPASVVALNQIEDAPDAQTASIALDDGAQGTVHWSESVGKTVLVSDGLPALTSDQQFELWFVRDGAAVPAGVFDAAAGGSATALLDGELRDGDAIAVTVEPQGGSPTGQPSGDPILVIPTA
ncbi:anti-sigma factor domain-containing protein [Microbacterium sp. P01]|uniref:anti-sigma factor n=1 Tax=Microbacterium sp. P01 TaxID=3366261 RepID=UPI00366CC08D